MKKFKVMGCENMNWENLLSNSTTQMDKKETIKLAHYVVDYCKKEKIDLTNLKLQKLMYFINIEYLRETGGQPIFREEFLAWRHGPVLQSVYDYFKYGIVYTTTEKIQEIKDSYNKKKISIINKVLKEKALKDVWSLVIETHIDNGPWYSVFHSTKTSADFCSSPISHNLIYNFYKDK